MRAAQEGHRWMNGTFVSAPRPSCAALVAGDIEQAAADFSPELRRNLGEVVALLPLPSHEATVDTIAHGGTGFIVTIKLVGETEEVVIQTRWKDRDGHPTLVEAAT